MNQNCLIRLMNVCHIKIVSYLEGATIQYLVDEKRIDLDAYFEFGKKMILTIIEEEVHKLQ